MEPFINLLKEINIPQIFVMFAGGWAVYARLDSKIAGLDRKIDKLNDKVEDVDRRLCKIEGGLDLVHFVYRNSRPRPIKKKIAEE